MPEQHDPFDAALRDRIGAAETRVRVSSTPPADPRPGRDLAGSLRPTLMLTTVTVAVLVVAAGLGQLTTRPDGDATPLASGSATSSLPAEATPVPTPPAEASSLLQWNRLPGPDVNCCPSLSAVEDRIFLAGVSDDGPVVWYSDDIGRTWTAGRILVPEAWEADVPLASGWEIAGTPDRLVAIGVRHPTRGIAEPAVWTSDDHGASWSAVADGPLPALGASLAWTGKRFVAVEDNVTSQGRRSSKDRPLQVWSSSDGTAWQPVVVPEGLRERIAVAAVVGFGGRAAILVADPSVASSLLGAPGSPAEHDRSGEIWLLDTGGSWTTASMSGDPIQAVGLGVGPYGLLAVASGRVDEHERDLLRSTDGEGWAAHRVELADSWSPSPHGPLGRAGWMSVLEGEGGVVLTASPGDWRTWHLAHGGSVARTVTALTADLVAASGGFLGIWQCADFALCIGPQAGLEAALPVAGLEPDTLTGHLTSCFQDERGYTWTLEWPEGYVVEPDPGRVANLVAPDGQVVARYGDELRNILGGGDRITVRGHRAASANSHQDGCVPGASLSFVVTEIVEVVPG